MPRTPHPEAAHARLLAAYRGGEDWMFVAAHNDIPPTTARRIVETGRVELRPRGGARSSCIKCTPEIEAAVEQYLDENCTYTLNARKDMLRSFGSMEAGDFIVYYDKTNCNVYCKRVNLQVQCAVSTEMGLVHCRLQRGSITMNVNAVFVDEIYDKVKSSTIFHEHFVGEKVVVVLDYAPAQNQIEDLITERDDLVLLRLALYSPMCNPIEGCFIVFKAKINADLVLSREELVIARPRGTFAAARMVILKRAVSAASAAWTCAS
ncbi:hypothetical protein PHMEG_0006906 [Phytophthora megakarya]|uniref:Uncharacterized protein n=1 Tax=Phytophthora megakarya TaxID=4795 RepID=A0A225WMT9_9STRA|nr:hypothetical protein PHMEG_0006906 [Phytophthora megakarya]